MLVLECIYFNASFACLPFSFLQIFKSIGSDETVQGQGSRRLISFSLSGMFCSSEGLCGENKNVSQQSGDVVSLTLTYKLLTPLPQFLHL